MPRALPPQSLQVRRPLAEALRALGMSRATFYRNGWDAVFTDYRTDGGQRRIADDELEEARAHPNPAKARAAVLRLRGLLGRRDES
jgi:hypothetical protein